MGLKGSKSMLTLRSFPSSVKMVPVYTTSPFEGTCIPQPHGTTSFTSPIHRPLTDDGYVSKHVNDWVHNHRSTNPRLMSESVNRKYGNFGLQSGAPCCRASAAAGRR